MAHFHYMEKYYIFCETFFIFLNISIAMTS